jgi:hypothetical protein
MRTRYDNINVTDFCKGKKKCVIPLDAEASCNKKHGSGRRCACGVKRSNCFDKKRIVKQIKLRLPRRGPFNVDSRRCLEVRVGARVNIEGAVSRQLRNMIFQFSVTLILSRLGRSCPVREKKRKRDREKERTNKLLFKMKTK